MKFLAMDLETGSAETNIFAFVNVMEVPVSCHQHIAEKLLNQEVLTQSKLILDSFKLIGLFSL